MLITKFLN